MSKRQKTIKRYGILDDFGDVIRWTWDKPTGRSYIVQETPIKTREDVFNGLLAVCGEALV